MKRKLRLKRNVKMVLALTIALIGFAIVLKIGITRWDKITNDCDNEYGRTCSYYETMNQR